MGSQKKNKNKVAAGKSAGAGESDNGNGKKVISDPRFSKVHSDPRFLKAPKHKAKVSIDSRFNRMFVDKRFATSSAPLDKRGKPKKQSENAIRRYYHLEDEEEEKIEKGRREKDDASEETDTESPVSDSSGESMGSESESDLESEGSGSDVSTSTTDTDEADDVEMLGDEASVEVENVPVIEKETHRLAVVNMDWNQVKAVDLFMMLKSCLPNGGQIKSVTVYPSEFGLERMEEEAVHGPVALFDYEKKKDGDDDEDNEDEIDTEKLRAYEKSRLRYYYAVVECDSVATADYLYKACDGLEFERSSNLLDLRFIPDSMEFQHPPRDVATEVPADYEGLDFHTRALQHSNVLLSWDDDDPHRIKKLRRKFNEKQLDELELKDFLASDESGSDEAENSDEDLSGKKKKVDKYRALVQSGDGSEEVDNEGQDMEVTFNADLEDISKKILEKKDKESETVWEAYLRKRKEKKRAKKNRSRNSSDDESDDSDEEPPEQLDDFFEEEPSGESSRKAGHGEGKKKREEKKTLEDKAAEASRAELELLLADEKGTENNVKGYKIKQKKAKGKKGKEAPDEDKLPAVEYDDPRFSALFTNPGFALDPTDPQFKRSATYFRQLAQRQQKGREEHAEEEPAQLPREPSNGFVKEEDKRSVDTSLQEKRELSAIVKSLKMKSKQLPVPSSSVNVKKGKMEANESKVKEKKKHKLLSLDRSTKKKAKV